MMNKMNKALRQRKHSIRECCSQIDECLKQKVDVEFIIFVENLSEEDLKKIVKIQRFVRRVINKRVSARIT